MKFSVITVCFNSQDTIAETIESVLSQEDCQLEYIVVDGNSTDDTNAVIEKYRDSIDVYISEPDSGIYDAMNKGLARASGDIVCILNSDDRYSSRYSLKYVLDEFSKDSELQLLFGDLNFLNFATSAVVRACRYERFKPWMLRYGWMPPHPASFVRRSVYKEFGPYKLDYQISSDYEMFVRWLMVHKARWKHIKSVLVDMRTGGASTSGLKSSYILNMEIIKACKSNGIYTNIFMIMFKLPFKLFELVKK